MSTLHRIIIVLLLALSIAPVQTFACTIQSGPTPALAAYIKNIQKEVSDIRSFASTNSVCTGKQGTFSNENRFLSLVDSIDERIPLGRDMVSDFEFRLMLTARGEARDPVMLQGEIIRNLETQTIIPALRTIVSTCTADTIMPSGKSPETALSDLLRQNRDIESYYKRVAIGNPKQPDELDSSQKVLYDEIRDNYSPHATASCKGAGEVGSLEDLMSKIQDRLGKKAQKTENSHKNWQDALALFAGAGTSTIEYQALQQRLLAAELTRQGLTARARDAMLGNLTCFQQNTTPTSTPEEMGRARATCMSSVVGGLENITNPFKKTILRATNTDAYIQKALSYDRAKSRLEDDMAIFWMKLEKSRNTDEKLNEKMITDLVDMHGKLNLTNALLCEKTTELYKVCMKGQPSILCPSPKCSK